MSNPHESFGSKEAGESVENLELQSSVNQGIKEALKTVKEDCEDKEQLEFHDTNHTLGVIKRTEAILQTIQEADPNLVTQRDIYLGKLAAAFHDTVQRSSERQAQGKRIMRARETGENEKKSAEKAVQFMEEENKRAGKEIYSQADIEKVVQAIAATIPDWNKETNALYQPKMEETDSIVAKAVGLADLGTIGMVGPEAYNSEGFALFREDNIDITRELKGKNISDISPQQAEDFSARMKHWLHSQVVFAEGRKRQFQVEKSQLPPKASQALEKLFTKFDETIESANQLAEQYEDATFEEIAKAFGYA